MRAGPLKIRRRRNARQSAWQSDSMPFEVEPSGEKLHEYECCGGRSHTIWGDAHEEGGPTRALYYVGWTDGHDDKVVRMTVSLGAWGEGATADDRRAVAVDMRAPEGSYGWVSPG
jgi:hypothetical protein